MERAKKRKMPSNEKDTSKLRHRFQTLSQEISGISLKMPALNLETEDKSEIPPTQLESRLGRAFEDLRDLNLTEEFTALDRAIGQNTNLAMVVLKKNIIREKLFEHLKKADPMYVDKVFEVTVAFAKDLQQDFKDYLQDFFPIAQECAKKRNAVVIKAVFQAMTDIIYVLVKAGVSRVEMLTLFLPMLHSEHQEYMTEFTAYALAPVLRINSKKDQKKERAHLLELLCDKVAQDEGLALGVAKLCLQSMKTTRLAFVPDFEVIWKETVNVLMIHEHSVPVIRYLYHLVIPEVDLTRNADATFASIVQMTCSQFKSIEKESHIVVVLDIICDLFRSLRTSRNGSVDLLLDLTAGAISKAVKNKCEEEVLAKVMAAASDAEQKLKFNKPIITKLIDGLWETDMSFESKCKLLLQKELNPNVSEKFFRMFLSNKKATLTVPMLQHFAATLSEYIQRKTPTELNRWSLEVPVMNQKSPEHIPNRMLEMLKDSSVTETSPSILGDILTCITFVRPFDIDLAENVLPKVLTDLIKSLENMPEGEEETKCLKVISSCTNALCRTFCPSKVRKTIGDLPNIIREKIGSIHSVRSIHSLSLIMDNASEIWTEEQRESLAKSAMDHLKLHPSERLLILKTIKFLLPNEHTEMAVAAEEFSPNIQEYRDRLRILGRLNWDETSTTPPVSQYLNLKYLVSNLAVDFTLLWEPCFVLITGYAQGMDPEAFRNVFFKDLGDAYSNIENAMPNGGEAQVKFRNLLLKCATKFVHVMERFNKDFVVMFLDRFIEKELRGKAPKSTASTEQHLQLLSMFPNISKVKRFSEVQKWALFFLSDKFGTVQKHALEIVLRSEKELAVLREEYTQLIDSERGRITADFINAIIGKMNSDKRKEEIFLRLLCGKVKNTTKQERKKNAVKARFMLQNILRQNIDEIQFSTLLLQDPIQSQEGGLTSKKMNHLMKTMAIFMDYGKEKQTIGKKILDHIFEYFGAMNRENSKTKERSRLLQMLYDAFFILKRYTWNRAEEQRILQECQMPLLKTMAVGGQTENIKEISQKVTKIFKLWIQEIKYRELFLFEDGDGKCIYEWLFSNIIASKTVGLKQKLETFEIAFGLLDTFEVDEMTTEAQKKVDDILKKNASMIISSLLDHSHTKFKNMNPESLRCYFNLLRYVSQWMDGERLGTFLNRISLIVLSLKGKEAKEACLDVIQKVLESQKLSTVPEKTLSLLSRCNDSREHLMPVMQKIFEGRKETEVKAFLFTFHSQIANLDGKEYAVRCEASESIDTGMKTFKSAVDEETFVSVLNKHMFPEIFRRLRRVTEHQREYLSLIQEILDLCSDSHHDYNKLMKLRNKEDEDMDFFENMKHVQLHRRGRAMKTLSAKLEEDPDFLPAKCLMALVFPLTRSFIFNEKMIKNSEVIESAIELMGRIALTQTWKNYKAFAFDIMKLEPKENGAFFKQKVKIIRKVLEGFHFIEAECTVHGAKEFINRILHYLGGDKEELSEQNLILFIPLFRIILTIPSLLDEYFNGITVKLCNVLKSRDHDKRDQARNVLSGVIAVLGPEFISATILILEASLTKGYQLHILLHTVWKILDTVSRTMTTSSTTMDTLVPKLMTLIQMEFFSTLAQEKRIAKIVKKTPEASKVSSHKIMAIIGQHVSKSSLVDVLGPLCDMSWKLRKYEDLGKIKQALLKFASGVCQNSSISNPELLMFSFGLLDGKILAEKYSPKITAFVQEFSLTILLSVLRKDDSNQLQDLVQHFLPTLVRNISKKSGLFEVSLNIMHQMSQRRDLRDILLTKDIITTVYTAFKEEMRANNLRVAEKFLSIMTDFVRSKSPVINTSFLTEIGLYILGCFKREVSTIKVIALLEQILVRNMEEDKAKEIIEQVCTVAIRSGNRSVFEKAKACIMRTMLKKEHIETCNWLLLFLLKQFEFNVEEGRARAIDMTNDVLEFILSEGKSVDHCSILLLCSVRLAKESDGECVKRLKELLSTLLGKSQRKPLVDLLNKCVGPWCSRENEVKTEIRIVAIQILTLLAKLKDDQHQKFIVKCVKELEEIIEKDATSLAASLLKLHFLELQTEMCQMGMPMKDVLSSLAEMLLDPSASVRSKSLTLLLQYSGKLMEGKSKKSKAGIEILWPLFLNLLEVRKTATATNNDLDNCVTNTIQLIVLNSPEKILDILKKLVAIFHFERRKLPNEFARRLSSLNAVLSFVSNCDQELQHKEAQEVIKVALFGKRAENTLEISDQILAAVRNKLDEAVFTELYSSSLSEVEKKKSKKLVHGKRGGIDEYLVPKKKLKAS